MGRASAHHHFPLAGFLTSCVRLAERVPAVVDFYSSFSPVFTFDTSETVEVCSDGPFTTRTLMPDIDDKVLQNITETLTAHRDCSSEFETGLKIMVIFNFYAIF